MKEEGKKRQAAYVEGKYVDIIEYGVMKEEYQRFREKMRG